MRCKNCQNIYNLSNEDDEIVGKWCPKINDSPDVDSDRECDNYKPMTNADRIRNMTDEELAIVIMCPYDGTKNEDCFMEGRNCIQCCMEWLQAEVEEGET